MSGSPHGVRKADCAAVSIVANLMAAAIVTVAASANVRGVIGLTPYAALPYNIMRTAPLAGKCALVTGSVRGLGLAAAQRLAAGGCHIVLNGLEPAAETASIDEDLQRHGVRSLYCRADLRRPGEIERMVETALDAFGSI